MKNIFIIKLEIKKKWEKEKKKKPTDYIKMLGINLQQHVSKTKNSQDSREKGKKKTIYINVTT